MSLFELSVLSPRVQHFEISLKKQTGGSASPLPIPHVCCCSWRNFHHDQILALILVPLLPLDSWRGNQALLWQHSSGTACTASLTLLVSPKRQRLPLAPSDQRVGPSDPNRFNSIILEVFSNLTHSGFCEISLVPTFTHSGKYPKKYLKHNRIQGCIS